ncbi:uncharacterized protein LOC126842975 isoform X2 [Adelges cooleyi]|uniref:uncharacterized protein LOC126842975 isoform X2 n=1 Tax=Adelges cooleyi TaxID=133065 RepID=UPI0021808678|nr:uncharacterized protein LOC126842975 isoform X2 [Adelges cooleyi]
MIWRWPLLLWSLVVQDTLAIPICPNQQNSKEHVVLGALLPLHTGEDCSATQMKGIQQLAALEYGLNAANSDLNGDVKISLQVLDTCSNANRAVKVTMKGLVSAEQTCLKSPLFLGYVGPDDQEILSNVQKITSLLNKTHVLPYKIDLKDRTSNVFFLGTDQTSKRANAINTMLRNLGWETYVPVVENSAKVTNVLAALFNLSNGRIICPVEKTILLPSTQNGYASVYRETIESQIRSSADGVLVIVDTPEVLGPLFNILSNSDNTQRPPFVVYVMTVGIKLWEIPRSDAVSMILMQESTESKFNNEIKQYFNESLLVTYRQQNRKGLAHNCSATESGALCLDALEDELDSSVMPITYSVHLFGYALRTAIDKKCKNELHSLGVCRSLQSMQSVEWVSIMKTATTILNGVDGPKRIRFQMETGHHVSVYMADVITKQVDLVAKLTNGDRLNFIKNVFLPASTRMTTGGLTDRPSPCQSYQPKSPKPTTVVPTPDDEDVVTVAREQDDWSPIWKFLPNGDKQPKEKDTYHVVTVLLCIGLGFLLFMIITIRILYKMFTFSQGNDQSSSKKKKKSNNTRASRGNSVSSRRVSRTSSIASTRST